MLFFNSLPMPFYDDSENSSGGKSTFDDAEANSGGHELAPEGPDIRTLFDPIEETDTSEGGERTPETPATPEGAQSPGEKPPAGKPDNVLDLANTENPFSVRLGDQVFDSAQLQQAIADHQNKSKWVTQLGDTSRYVKWIQNQPPEYQERFMAWAMNHVHGKEALPEDMTGKAIEFDWADADDYQAKIKIDPNSEEYSKIREHFFSQFMAENQPTFKELREFQEQREAFSRQQQEFERKTGNEELQKFIDARSIDLPVQDIIKSGTAQDLMDVIANILETGPANPYYPAVERLVATAQRAQTTGMNFSDQYDLLYGKPTDNSQRNATAKKKQKGGLPLTPAGSATPGSDDEGQFLKRVTDPTVGEINELFKD